jgi:hypothetical protein
MKEPAILLDGPSADNDAVASVLEFFGVPFRRLSPAEWIRDGGNLPPARIFAPANVFLELIGIAEKITDSISIWQNCIHSAFVFASNDVRPLEQLLGRLAGKRTDIPRERAETNWQVSDRFPELSGALNGIKVASRDPGLQMVMEGSRLADAGIIIGKDGAAFAKLNFKNVPVFLSTTRVIDIHCRLSGRNFDIRDHFLSAAPAVMFVKWAFPETCFQPEETSACLIIDDPPLKPRYGFLNFHTLNDLMERCHFTSSLAFIPWNWWRDDSRTIELFKNNSDRFSISVHGCDHTRAEFGIQNGGRLHWMVDCASGRMKRHESRTGLSHDSVMVFPQGIFSETAMRALKGSDFVGVVNSEVISVGPEPGTVRISDFWNVAVMNYDSFPIFTRRYPWQGLENFAFDILLGKPCIAVVHHNDCHDDCRHVAAFIEKLNRLNARLAWRSLGDVVRRSFRRRELSANVAEIEMFGKELLLENDRNQKKHFCVRKTESAPDQIKEIRAGDRAMAWTAIRGGVAFLTEAEPRSRQMIRIVYHGFSENGFSGENLPHRFNAALRRYLCEFRDNYVTRKSFSQ